MIPCVRFSLSQPSVIVLVCVHRVKLCLVPHLPPAVQSSICTFLPFVHCQSVCCCCCVELSVLSCVLDFCRFLIFELNHQPESNSCLLLFPSFFSVLHLGPNLCTSPHSSTNTHSTHPCELWVISLSEDYKMFSDVLKNVCQ